MKKVAIVVGHGPIKDKGAENVNGTTELVWNTGLAKMIMDRIPSYGDVLEGVLIFRKTEGLSPVQDVNDAHADFAVELHCNAFDRKATGTEMIHYPNSTKGILLAKQLQVKAVATLQLPDRGVKTAFKGRGDRFLGKTNCPAVIVESFFIDNSADLARANFVKTELADAYVKAMVNFAHML